VPEVDLAQVVLDVQREAQRVGEDLRSLGSAQHGLATTAEIAPELRGRFLARAAACRSPISDRGGLAPVQPLKRR
jgi:hypothetical protein